MQAENKSFKIVAEPGDAGSLSLTAMMRRFDCLIDRTERGVVLVRLPLQQTASVDPVERSYGEALQSGVSSLA